MEFRWIYGIDEIANCHQVRKEVFIVEQSFNADTEFDEIDKIAYHLEVTENGAPIATARVFKEHETDSSYHCGRICIKKEFRKTGLGIILMEKAAKKVASLGGSAIELSAQIQAKGFYEKAGYIAFGEEYLDEHCPHIMMKRDIAK